MLCLQRWSSSMEEQVRLAELPAALDSTLMVPRSGLQHAAVTSYGYKLQCLWIQVRKIARERDKAKLDLEKAERHCLHLGRELDEQYVALKHTQSKLKDLQAEIEAKELLLQQAVSHQAKLEADTQFLQGKEASLQGRLNHVMKQNTELQNKVTEMTEKLSASEELVLELQKELNHIVKEKLGQGEPHSPEFLSQSERFAEIVLEYERQCQVLYDQNRALRRELQRLRLQLQESRAETGLPAREMSLPVEQLQEQLQELKVQLEAKINYYKEQLELMQKNFERERKDSEESFKAEMHKMEDQKRDLEETVAKYWAVISSLKEQKPMWSLELEERFEVEQARVGQHHTEDICHPGQQLDQEGEELRTQQHQDRLSLRKHVNKLGREKVEELAGIAELTMLSEKSKEEVSHPNVKVHQLGCELTGHKAGHSAQLQSQRLAEAEWPRGAEVAARLEHHQKHAACWMEVELLQQQLKASQEKLLEAKASLSLAQTQHALQLQQAKAQMNNMVSKQQFEQLQTTLREEQCKTQQLQESLHQQAEQTCRQLVSIQAEHEHLLQAAVEQAEGLEHSLRSAEAVLAERAAQLRDAQAQLSRNKLLIEDLRGENRGFAVAMKAAELKQKSTEEKNQLLEEKASALKQLIGKITPASLSG
ncbi:ninein-like protein isoform X6 [Manacus vitellinus]|uniref:ninein-like protein isoform X6 n=1 Tax=Manacus vitellinus TaxID=328815 RepID=UPI00115E45D4|nr:ninein-like protein isoform X6 [Manacus vitellinus]